MESGRTPNILPPALALPTPPAGIWPLLSIAGCTAMAVLLIALLGHSELFRPIPMNTLQNWVALLAASFAALVIHEAGHLLAALACRFEVLTVSLGAFRFARERTGWRMRTRTQRIFTGSVVAIPRTNELWRERMMAVVAAGPLATLLSILLAAYLLQAHISAGEFVWFFLRGLVQISFLIFVLGLVPNSPKSRLQNDSTLFLILWRDGKEANEIFLYHLVLQHQKTGLEPYEFPLWLIELMASFQGRPDFMSLYAGMIASWSFDREDRRIGDLWDERALLLSSYGNLSTQHACLANSACFDLVFRDDRASAKAKLARIQIETLNSPSLQHQALATRNLAFGRIAKSLADVATARSFLQGHLQDRGFECSLLKRLHASALSAR